MHRSVILVRCGFAQIFKRSSKLNFSSSGNLLSKDTNDQEKFLPTLIYVQNPISWLINKIDFRMLKTAWDSEFDENEFKRGTIQAVSVISRAVSNKDWEILAGLVTKQALRRLKREVETGWSDYQKRNVALEPGHLKLALPRRVRFSRIGEEKLVDVDSVFVGLKFEDPVARRNLVFVESAARFHRNYSFPESSSGWTVSVFKGATVHVYLGFRNRVPVSASTTTMGERTIPSVNSLVKYDNPVLVTKHAEKKAPRKAASPSRAAGPSADQKRETEEILNAILPPKEWEEDGNLWLQQVSSVPATRLDVINLQEQLDMRLQQRQARETGICPVRRELYTQCFDELIRQVTINCAERGLLLLRVRDEIRMTVAAYQTLYESSIAFGMRKALQAEQGKADLEDRVSTLVEEKADLERQVADLRAKAEQVERRSSELRQAEEKKHNEEIQFLKKTNQQLKSQLEGIIAPKK